jgi:hypothetical protein
VYPQECLPGHRDACRDREAGPFRGAAGPGAGAAALVRRTGGGIIPSQAQAANQLGLTTQVPARNVFHTSSGKTRRVRVGNQTIELRRAEARRSPPGRSDGTEAVLQGLMFVSEGYVTPEIVAKVRRQRAVLRTRLADAPAWMHPALREISWKDGAAR